MKYIIPPKLTPGDTVRIIAPSQSYANIEKSIAQKAAQRLQVLGLQVTYGDHLNEIDAYGSSSTESRMADLHAAFANPNVKAIITARGGFNANQLLDHIDWELIRNNPKILCGFSDITILHNAILAMTGVVSYSGPNFSRIGKDGYNEYTEQYLKACLFEDGQISITPSFGSNWLAINPGETQGTIVGGNLCTLNLVQGTPYFPDLTDTVLFLEDDHESNVRHFDRNLQSLLHLPEFQGVRGIVIGRFQPESGISPEILRDIIKSKKKLEHIPVLANVDFGHTDPMITFPVGGLVTMKSSAQGSGLIIDRH